jgi:hypothetical protein
MTQTDIQNFVNSLDSFLTTAEGMAAVIPTPVPEAVLVQVKKWIDLVAPVAEQPWVADAINSFETLLGHPEPVAMLEKLKELLKK